MTLLFFTTKFTLVVIVVYNYDQYNCKKTFNISFLLAVLIMAFHLQGISLVNSRAACFTFWDK